MNSTLKTFQEILADFTYKPGWSFSIINYPGFQVPPDPRRMVGYSIGTLQIRVETINSRGAEPITIDHHFPIPEIPFPRDALVRMLLDNIISVEIHEAMEFFTVGDEKPFFPDHRDPYTIPGPLFLAEPLPSLR